MSAVEDQQYQNAETHQKMSEKKVMENPGHTWTVDYIMNVASPSRAAARALGLSAKRGSSRFRSIDTLLASESSECQESDSYPGMVPSPAASSSSSETSGQRSDSVVSCTEEHEYKVLHAPIPTWPIYSPEEAAAAAAVNATGYYGSPLITPFDYELAAQRLRQQEAEAQQARRSRPKKFACTQCPARFANRGQLRGHYRIHTGERPFKCTFEGCSKDFTRNEELTRHRRIHYNIRPFQCAHCGKNFGRKDHLKKHSRIHERAFAVGLQREYAAAIAAAAHGIQFFPSY